MCQTVDENEIGLPLLLGVIRGDDAAVHASQEQEEDDDCDVDRRLRSRWSLYHGGIWVEESRK